MNAFFRLSNKTLYGFAFVILFFLFPACSDVFEYHPNEVILKENERNLNEKNLAELAKKEPSDTICFVLMGDTQRFYDELEDFSRNVEKDKEVEFIIHAGDISDFGWVKEYKWVHKSMKTIPVPYFTVVGNHDLLANGKNVYLEMYGPTNYTFEYGFVKFVLFDSNSREHQFGGKTPNLEWIKEKSDLSDLPHIEQLVLISHIPPHSGDFDPDLKQSYIDHCINHSKIQLSLHGHSHSWQEERPAGERLLIHTTSSTNERTYSKVKIWKDGYALEKVIY